MASARYFDKTGVLVLTSHAFGTGHLFSDSGRDQWWFKTWAVKSGGEEIQRKWQAMGEGEIPIPCLLFVDEFAWVTASPDPLPEFVWIRDEIAKTRRGIHVPSEVVRSSWLDSTVEETRYPWRLRVTATGPFRFTPPSEEII